MAHSFLPSSSSVSSSAGSSVWQIFEGSGLTNLRAHPQLLLIPALVVASLMLAFNLLGDALTDVLSPRRR